MYFIFVFLFYYYFFLFILIKKSTHSATQLSSEHKIILEIFIPCLSYA